MGIHWVCAQLVEVACVPEVSEECAAFDAKDGYNSLL
jgi:hypothetical protein